MKRTDQIDREHAMAALAADMKRVAAYGRYNGRVDTPEAQRYMTRCTRVHRETGTRLLYTRDYGHHTSGWWKNPDYEYCVHLSLSFVDPETGANRARDQALSARWCELFFEDWRRFIWAEPPYSPHGKAADVWHYRVFTSADYRTPLLPRGEVYARELTEAAWRSYSDLGYERRQAPIDEGVVDG